MSKHRIAVIGLGMAVTPHAGSLVDLRARVEVACAFSRSEARRRAFAERFDFPLTGDLDRIVDDASVGAVMILTPPNTHLELVERCARAGKHILLEKPLERSTERALRLIEAVEAAGVKLGVVFQHRFPPDIVEAILEGRQPKGLRLGEMLGNARLACERTYDRCVGICYLGGTDIAAEMVRRGLARDCPRYSGGRYAEAERAALEEGAALRERYMLPTCCLPR